jgi:hypothetical protein
LLGRFASQDRENGSDADVRVDVARAVQRIASSSSSLAMTPQ